MSHKAPLVGKDIAECYCGTEQRMKTNYESIELV